MKLKVGDRVVLVPCPPRRPNSKSGTIVRAYSIDTRWGQAPEVYNFLSDDGEKSYGWLPCALEKI